MLQHEILNPIPHRLEKKLKRMKYKDVPYFSLLKCYLRSSTHTRNQRKLCIVSYSKGSSIHTQIYEDILSHLTLLYRHGRFSGFLTGNSDGCNTLYEPVKVVYCLILERRTSPITGTLSQVPLSLNVLFESVPTLILSTLVQHRNNLYRSVQQL